jgi:anti-sigma regulatory factor (Ser/Thr protein kinase)
MLSGNAPRFPPEAEMPKQSMPEQAVVVLGEQVQLCIPSSLAWVEPTVEHLKNRALLAGACDASQAGRLLLALHEALTNAIVHGNLELASRLKEEEGLFGRRLAERSLDPAFASRLVHIHIDYDGRRCRWTLTDQGPGFDFEEVLAREPADPWAVSGRGIQLMRALMDEVRYEAGSRRVVLTLVRAGADRPRPAPAAAARICS